MGMEYSTNLDVAMVHHFIIYKLNTILHIIGIRPLCNQYLIISTKTLGYFKHISFKSL